MLIYRKIVSLFILVMIAFSFLACNDQKGNAIIYKKPASEKLDATCTWLQKEDNFSNKKYMGILYNYYNQKIREKNYLTAAKALEVVAWNTASFASFDPLFFQTISTFSKKYKKEIPESNTRFIDMYLGDYYTDKGNLKKAIEAYAKNTIIDVVNYRSCYLKADSYRTITWCYHQLGKQNLALKNELKSLEYFKKTDNIAAIGGVYVGISEIYQASKEYGKTEDLLNKAIFNFSKDRKKNIGNIFICLYNKINLYDRSVNYSKRDPLIDSVYFAFKKSKIQDSSLKISINNPLGVIKLFDF
jgi:two-component system NarL family sensor kinase